MKDESFEDIPDKLLRERFGNLTDEELLEVRSELVAQKFDPEADRIVNSVLEKSATASRGDAPPLPESVRRSFENARLSVENASADADVYATPKRYQSEPSGTKPMSRLHSISVISGGLAAAAAIVVAYVTYIRPVDQAPVITYADNVTLLTPGEKTGFIEPIFTWKSGNGGVVDVRVLSSAGETVASLDTAFSPLRWSSLKSSGPLDEGEVYELEIRTPDGLLSSRSFETGVEASGAPAPGESLESIIKQCQALIAANRPADAWMLWGELTSTQKSDPRMQELKDEILSVIAG